MENKAILDLYNDYYRNHNNLEVCYYYNSDENKWYNGTGNSTKSSCYHNKGYQNIMGHAHPYQAKKYPSFEDIVFPLFQHGNKNHSNYYFYTFTSIGYYVSIYENPIKLVKPSNYKEHKTFIETYYCGGLYILLNELNTELQYINKDLNSQIDTTCYIISEYINEKFRVYGYNLIFIPLREFYFYEGGNYLTKTKHIKYRKKLYLKQFKKSKKNNRKKSKIQTNKQSKKNNSKKSKIQTSKQSKKNNSKKSKIQTSI